MTPYIPKQSDMIAGGRYAVFNLLLPDTVEHSFEVSASLGPGMVGRSAYLFNFSFLNLAWFKLATPDGKWGEEIIVGPGWMIPIMYDDGVIIGKVGFRGSIGDTLQIIVCPGRLPEPPVSLPAPLQVTGGKIARSVLK
jgi:hypothetical protein